VAAEAAAAFAAAAAEAFIAAAAEAFMAAGATTAEVMASMAVAPAAGGTSTASASAGGDLGSIAVAQRDREPGAPSNRRAFSFWWIDSDHAISRRLRR